MAEIAEQALQLIPPRLRNRLDGLGILVEEEADDELLDELGLESPYELAGVYMGTPLTNASLSDVATRPNMILLFRQAILLEWIETDEELARVLRNVLIHEIAHHFGFDDDEIAALEREADASYGSGGIKDDE